MTPPRLVDYLRHMLEACERVTVYASGLNEKSFELNELVQDAVIPNIEVIGEASRRIEVQFPEFANAHPELPLSAAYQMRNAVAHGYFQIDLGVVWTTLQTDLPALAELLRNCMQDLEIPD